MNFQSQLRYIIAIAVFALATALVHHTAFAGPADLDTEFADNGVMTLDFGLEEQASVLLIEEDLNGLRFVVAGRQCKLGDFGDCDFLVARIQHDFQMDQSFASDGWTTASMGMSSYVSAAAFTPSGEVLVVGDRKEDELIGVDHDFALAQFNETGELDTSFHSDGKVMTGFGDYETPWDVAIQPDGKIITIGRQYQTPTFGDTDYDFAIARYHADGSLDKSFDDNGKLVKGFGKDDHAYAVALQVDGKIVVAGQTGRNFIVVRFNQDGRLDKGFGDDGKVVAQWGSGEIYEEANDIVITANGQILVSGVATIGGNNDFLVARLNADGSFDSSFGSGGWIAADFDGRNDRADTLMIDDEGRILLTGCSQQKFAVARFFQNGMPDKSFGDGGQALNEDQDCGAAALGPGGRIFVAHSVDNGNNSDVQLVAFKGSSEENGFSLDLTDLAVDAQELVPVYKADLRLEISDAQDPVESGSELGYAIRISNLGPNRADNIVLSNELPAGVSLKEIDFPIGSCTTTNPIVCNFSELAAGVTMTGTMLIEVGGAGFIETTMTITSDVIDPELNNNQATEMTAITLPPLSPESTPPETTVPTEPTVTTPEAPANSDAAGNVDGPSFAGENTSAQRAGGGCSLVRR